MKACTLWWFSRLMDCPYAWHIRAEISEICCLRCRKNLRGWDPTERKRTYRTHQYIRLSLYLDFPRFLSRRYIVSLPALRNLGWVLAVDGAGMFSDNSIFQEYFCLQGTTFLYGRIAERLNAIGLTYSNLSCLISFVKLCFLNERPFLPNR